MLLHSILNFPEAPDLELWPFAIDYAAYLWNHMPHIIHYAAYNDVQKAQCSLL